MRASRILRNNIHSALVIATGCVLASRPSHAQSPAPGSQTLSEARSHFERGIGLFRQRDFDAALAEFLRAYELSQRPSVLFNISATYQALHRYPEALETLHRYLTIPNGDARQRAEAERALRELEALVARVRITAVPADATVTIDGRTVGNLDTETVVGPGQHVIEGSRDGYQTARQELMIASGESREVRVELAAAPVPEPAPPLGAADTARDASLPRASLRVTGAPATATLGIDGVVHPASDVAALPPGPHNVTVSAPGMRAWSGEVVLSDERLRTLRVSLVPAHSGFSPGYFASTAVATGVLVAGAIVFGALTLQTDAEFQMRSPSDPDVDALASRGHAFAATADILMVGAVITGALAVMLFTRTEFTPRASRGELVVGRNGVRESLPHGHL